MIQATNPSLLHQRYWLAATLLVVVFAAWYVPSVEGNSCYWEHFYSCRGRSMYPRVYENLASLCDDCQNLYRDNSVYCKCRENCFRNEFLVTCMGRLLLPYGMQHQYLKNASIIHEGKK